MKQGLLFKDAPEPRFELYCDKYSKYPKNCNFLFDNEMEFEKHQLDVHNIIPGQFYSKERRWYSTDYLKREGFKQLKFQLPLRPTRRFKVTYEMLQNIGGPSPGTKKCWCGKLKKDWDSRYFQTYCSDKHRDQWWILTDYVGPHKDKFLRKHKACEKCNYECSSGWGTYPRLEMDHIIAIVLGGHPWHEDNLQALCDNCHKIKTKSDVGILAAWRRLSNYDTGAIIPDPQLTLDELFQYEYV